MSRPVTLPENSRLVLKIGSSSLTRVDGGLDMNRIDEFSRLVAALRARGHDVVIVSSGAVACGMGPLGLSERPPADSPLAQAAASVGQSRLMRRWQSSMSAYGVVAAQILLTAQEVASRKHYRTVRSTFDSLLSLGAVPIVNENDAVTTDELTLGDNDRLAALVTHLVTADLLIMFTDVDGVWTAAPGTPGAQPIRLVTDSKELTGLDVSARGAAVGTGGMATKLLAATAATASGTATLIARADDAARILSADADLNGLGTWFSPTGPHRHSRRLWIAYASTAAGRIAVDEGAAQAITVRKKSLLLPGVQAVTGEFEAGDVVEIVNSERVIARGICRYSAAELAANLTVRESAGGNTDRLAPVVHRDDLAELPR